MKYRVSLFVTVFFLLLQCNCFAISVRDVVYTPKNSGKVVFSHGEHITKKDMNKNCRACHDAIFDIKKKKRSTMADMAKGQSCGACHTGGKVFSLAECARCHQSKEIVFNVKATGPTRFSHKSHLAASVDCGVCHPTLFKTVSTKRFTMADMKKGKSCGACHNGKKAFSVDTCVTCHPVKEITYQVKETGPTHFSHSVHLSVAQCSECHPKTYSPTQKNKRVGMAAMTQGKSCGMCHNAKQAFSVKECSKCHPVRELKYEEKSTGDVLFSHTFHTGLYTCTDCHSSLYKTARSTAKISMTEMEKGKSCGQCHDGKSAFSVKEKCEVCHKM